MGDNRSDVEIKGDISGVGGMYGGTVNQTINNYSTEQPYQYPKELDEIIDILIQRYPTIKGLKDAIFEFLEKDNLGFKEILKSESFDELIKLLFMHKKECFYCIFKTLEIENDYVNRFKTHRCQEFKQGAFDTLMIVKIVLRIHQSSAGSLDNCWAEGWIFYNTDIAESLEKLENIDFSSDYTKLFSTYIDKALADKNVGYPLDLDLILDDGLFAKDFQKLAIDKYLNITTQLLYRNHNFFRTEKLKKWRENSSFYENRVKEKIENYIFPIKEIYNRRSLINCTNDKKIVVVSTHNILNIQYLELIKISGLPFLFSPCSDRATEVDFKWNGAIMVDLKSKAIVSLHDHYNRVDYFEKEQQPLDEEKNIQFIYDNYHDVAKFKEIINETDEKIQG